MAASWEADRDLYLDGDGNVVEDGDPTAAFLLCRAGRLVDADTVAKHGLGPKPKPKSKARSRAKTKAVRGPEEDK